MDKTKTESTGGMTAGEIEELKKKNADLDKENGVLIKVRDELKEKVADLETENERLRAEGATAAAPEDTPENKAAEWAVKKYGKAIKIVALFNHGRVDKTDDRFKAVPKTHHGQTMMGVKWMDPKTGTRGKDRIFI